MENAGDAVGLRESQSNNITSITAFTLVIIFCAKFMEQSYIKKLYIKIFFTTCKKIMGKNNESESHV